MRNEANEVTLGEQTLPAGPEQEAYIKHGFFPKMKRVLRKIPFAEDAVAMYYAAFDPATPKWARRVAVGALAYFVLPIDVIPDMLIITGYTDDASILAMAVALLAKYVTGEHHKKAQGWLAEKR